MVSIYHVSLICCGGNQSAASQMISFSKQSAGSLMDSGYSVLIKKIVFNACDGQVMFEVILHSGKIGALQVAAGHHSGGQGLRRTVGQFVDEVVLSGQDDGQVRLGVFFKLTQRMQFSKYFQ